MLAHAVGDPSETSQEPLSGRKEERKKSALKSGFEVFIYVYMEE